VSKRAKGKYPKPPFLGRTYRKATTSLDGARGFLAGENLIIPAADRNALAAVGGRVWLRPSATLRLGNYLDMRPPMIGGWTLHPDPLGNVFSATPGDLYDKFVEASGQIAPVGGRDARLRSELCEDPDDRFDHSAVLTYQSLYTIEGGERLHHEPDVRLYFRRGADAVHAMAVMRRNEEKSVVQNWLTAVANVYSMQVKPVHLIDELPERHNQLRQILARLGTAPLAYRHPETFQREGGKAPGTKSAKYHEYRRSGSDRTWMVDIETVLDDADTHQMRVGAINAFLFADRDRAASRNVPTINEVMLHQRPGSDDMLRVSWKGGRLAPDGRPRKFDDEYWGGLALLDWTEEQKRSYLLDVWELAADLPKRAAAPASSKPARKTA
jgi:hypothetical protein